MRPREAPLHLVARAIGVPPDGGPTDCAVCGVSPFAAAGPTRRVLGRANFVAVPAPDTGAVCEGCRQVLGGKPGREPPPLRMTSLLVLDDPEPVLHRLTQADWWPVLSRADFPPAVLSRAVTRKRQHVLHAGWSGRGQWRVGSDDGPVAWTHDADLLAAVEDLRALGASKGAVLSGRYRLPMQAAHGAAIARAERVLTRWRTGPVLDLVVHAAPSDPAVETGEEDRMALSAADETGVAILAAVAQGSTLRVADGRRFWGGLYRSRLGRFSRLPLVDCVSRLIGAVAVQPAEAARAARLAADLEPAAAEAVSEALRTRGAALHALAFERIQEARAARRRVSPARPAGLFGSSEEESHHGHD